MKITESVDIVEFKGLDELTGETNSVETYASMKLDKFSNDDEYLNMNIFSNEKAVMINDKIYHPINYEMFRDFNTDTLSGEQELRFKLFMDVCEFNFAVNSQAKLTYTITIEQEPVRAIHLNNTVNIWDDWGEKLVKHILNSQKLSAEIIDGISLYNDERINQVKDCLELEIDLLKFKIANLEEATSIGEASSVHVQESKPTKKGGLRNG